MHPRTVLQLNGFSTAVCAIVMLAARRVLHPLFGLETPLLLDTLAIAFLAYAAALLTAARQQPITRGVLLFFTVSDVVFVVACAIALLVFWSELETVARLLVIAVALVVELFATLQYRAAGGLQKDALLLT